MTTTDTGAVPDDSKRLGKKLMSFNSLRPSVMKKENNDDSLDIIKRSGRSLKERERPSRITLRSV